MSDWRELLSEFDLVEPSGTIPAGAIARAAELDAVASRRVALPRWVRWVAAGAAAAVVLIMLALAAHSRGSTEPAKPSPTPHTKARGLIVFGVRRDIRAVAGSAVYSIHPNGTGRMLLYGRGLEARLSPDGTTIMDEGRNGLIRYRLGGTRVHRMNGVHNPGPDLEVGVWNPDGQHMVCLTKFGMFEYDTATATTWRRVLNDGYPIGYSPDGSKLLFSGTGMPGEIHDLFALDAGSDPVRADPAQINPDGTSASAGVGRPWSPDGTRVVFTAAKGNSSKLGTDAAVYVANADGSNAHPITPTGAVSNTQWSPSGEWIAYDATNQAGDRDIYVVRPDGTARHRVTNAGDGLNSLAPLWGPDGTWILFTRKVPDNHRPSSLWIARPDGSSLTQVTHQKGGYSSYGWSDQG